MNRQRALGRILERHLAVIRAELPRTFAGDGLALHHARVTSRRAREVLPVVAAAYPAVDIRKPRRRLRRVTRTLGAVRELDVTLLVLAGREKAGSLSHGAAESARRSVMRPRAERRRVMLERITIEKFEKLQRKILTALASAAEQEPDAERRARVALAGRVAQRADALRQAIADAGAMYLPDRLHVLRVAVKKLRYTLELVGETRYARTAPLVRRLRRAQNVLGELHDLEVTALYLQSHEGAETRRGAVRKELASGVREAQADCRRLHARYVAARQMLGEICRAARQEVALAIVERRRPVSARSVGSAIRRRLRAAPERRSA